MALIVVCLCPILGTDHTIRLCIGGKSLSDIRDGSYNTYVYGVYEILWMDHTIHICMGGGVGLCPILGMDHTIQMCMGGMPLSVTRDGSYIRLCVRGMTLSDIRNRSYNTYVYGGYTLSVIRGVSYIRLSMWGGGVYFVSY